MKIPSNILTLIAGVTLTLVSLWYGQNHGLLPVAASHEAELVDDLFDAMMVISVGLVLLVEGVLIIAAIRFRRRDGDQTDGPHLEGNVPLEILWTSIPTVIVLGISVYSFSLYQEMGGLNLENQASEPETVQVAYSPDGTGAMSLIAGAGNAPKPSPMAAAGIGPTREMIGQAPPVTVNVKALQYAFIFTYADSGVISGDLKVPANRGVKLVMEAQDVIHAFWVPELRLKQDIVPGQTTELAFIPTRQGTYPVVCAELCGPYHGAMRTQIQVQSPEEFDTWMQSQIASLDSGVETVAAAPAAERSDADYLASFAEPLNLEIEADTLAELQDSPQSHNHHPYQLASTVGLGEAPVLSSHQ